MLPVNLELLLPFLAYAETHYAFKGVYSRLKKNEPEVIVDAPHRIEPKQHIPILLLVKDAHRYPAEIHQVDITLAQEGHTILHQSIDLNTPLLREKYHYFIIAVDRPAGISGAVTADVQFDLMTNHRVRKYYNDNYRISSHAPLELYLADDLLPQTDHWYFGDLHCHTAYTEDMAEFGAPLDASIQLAQAIGLNFFAATDHSYDLDDEERDYLKNDPHLKKWAKFKNEVLNLQQRYSNFLILPGEEVSAGNYQRRNVHLLIINHGDFIHGKGDSAEKWLRTTPDHAIPEILDAIDENALAIAAHPEMATPLLQWLLIRRGRWQWRDYLHDRLDGLQIWNGATDDSFHRGRQRWIDLLLHGKKRYIYAGNDAHGNFNRFRQIGFPFWTFREFRTQLFGQMRTVVKVETAFNLKNFIHALKEGRCIITDGPFMDFQITNEMDESALIGGKINGILFTLKIRARSTAEFGRLHELIVYYGNLTTKEEILLQQYDQFAHEYSFDLQQVLPTLAKPGYLRLELTSVTADQPHRCLTNPIWID